MSKRSNRIVRKPMAEALEPRAMMAADAAVTWNTLTSQPLIGEKQTLQLRFDNVGDAVGYGPYIDVVLPTQGKDDAGGVRYVPGSAVLLDTPLREMVLTFDATGKVSHPLAKDNKGSPVVLQGTPGSQLVVLELPFGSYVADQPAVQIEMQVSVDANAELGESIQLVAAGGFQFGKDALNNPTTDPSLRGAAKSLDLVPSVVSTRIEYLGPEDETANGPSFVRAYRVSVDVASGAQIDRLQLVNTFDSEAAYLGLSETSWKSDQYKLVQEPKLGVPTKDAMLQLEIPTIQGVPGVDGSYIVKFYVPEKDASEAVIIDPIKAVPAEVTFTSQAAGDWVKPAPVPGEDAEIQSVKTNIAAHELVAKAVAVQQSARIAADSNAAGIGPGDIVEYALRFQVSDFVSLNNIVFETEIPNGQEWIADAPVTISVAGVEGLDAGKELTSQFGLDRVGETKSGGVLYRIYLSKELESVGLGSTLFGGWTAKGNKTGVEGTITYRAKVLDAFQQSVASGDASIDERDVFTTGVTATGETLEPETFNPTGVTAEDGSGTRMQVPNGRLQTSVYAINGQSVVGQRQAVAGDLVTYRITRTVNSSDIEDLVLNDYLPLPVHSVAQIKWADAKSAPSNGSLQLGPQDTFHALLGSYPKATLDVANNRVSLNYGDVDSTKNQTTVIDLLITVVVEDKPFADGMWLTNLANATYGSSNNGSASQNALTNIQYTRPVLNIVKGVLSTDNPRGVPTPAGSNDANVSGVDAADKVRFQVLVTNTGLSAKGAFDTLIKDTMPGGYIIPASGLDLKVTDANGREWKWAPESATDANPLFGKGLRFLETIPGANAAAGTNQVVISYTLEVSEAARLFGYFASEAQVVSYAAVPKGVNYATSKIADSAWTRIANATVAHTLIATDQASTTSNRLVVGETGTFMARIAMPEGTLSTATLQLNLPRGLAIRELVSITPSDALKFATFSPEEIAKNASLESTSADDRDAARRLTMKLGDVINTDRDNSRIETIEVVYTATVINDLDVQAGVVLRNNATISHTGGSNTSTASMNVVEPNVEVIKTWKTPIVDAMDKITLVMDVRSPSTGATAFDVSLAESVPAGMSYVPGSLRWISGSAKPVSFSDKSGALTASWNSIAPGQTARFEYDVIVANDVHAGSVINTQADVEWSSLPGEPGQLNANSKLSFERTGDVSDPGTTANDYLKSYASTLTIAPVTLAMKLVDSSHTFTSGTDLTIGEQATFEIVATIPEGVHALELSGLASSLAPQLNIESLELVSIGKNLSGDAIKVGMVGIAQGASLSTIDLGVVTNRPDNVVSASDQMVFRLITRVPNKAENVAGQAPNTEVRMDYRYGVASVANLLRVVEPALQLKQTVSRSLVNANDTVDATITLTHTGSSTSTAIAIQLRQAIDAAGLTLVPGSISLSSGNLLSGNNAGDTLVEIASSDLALGKSITLSYKVQVPKNAKPGDSFELPASVVWFSMDGDESRRYSTDSSVTLRVGTSGLIGSVFLDHNQDGGFQAGDYNIPDVKIVLTGIDHLGNPVVAETMTDANGFYRFGDLRPGVYTLTQIQPEDFVDGQDFAGSLGGQVKNDEISNIVIPLGSNQDFGRYRFTESPLTWISGTVFVDENQNRKLEADEEGVEGVEVVLTGKTRAGVPVSMKTTTNERGYYVFGFLEPGTYSVIEGATPGFFDAFEQIGNRGGKTGADRFDNIVITASKPADYYNFGEYRPAVIQGQIYIDYDRDGVMDRKDGLLANVKVMLTGVNDLGQTVSLTTTTDTKGAYRFENLRPGKYDIASVPQDGLDYSVSNVGIFNGGASSVGANGLGVQYGFASIQLPAGAIGNGYNIGHVDPDFESTILGSDFDRVVVINGTKGDDVFKVQMSGDQGTIDVNGESIVIDNKAMPSIRIMGSFGNDRIEFVGTEDKEEINLRRGSARITGTWFESLIYGMETISFIGGGNEDLARFYDTDGNETFEAWPMNAKMVGADFVNSVQDVHRIYAAATSGLDTAKLTGKVNARDNFHATPENAKLYGDDFYLYTTAFDSVVGIATDPEDRASLFGSAGNDEFSAAETLAVLSGATYRSSANGYRWVSADAGLSGADRARLLGTAGDDQLTSYPLDASFDSGRTRIHADGFESLTVLADAGNDSAIAYDSHFQDTLTAQPGSALLRNSTGDVQMTGFESLNAKMEAGGDDVAILRGSTSVDTFKASPSDWSLEGTGFAMFGVGFTKVTAFGDASDIAYLYDSAYNDVLELTTSNAISRGQRFSNEANGFGKVNTESQGGFDRVVFMDSAVRSTVRYDGNKATIFGSGFSYNATGYSAIDAYYADLSGLDGVDFNGKIEYSMVASDIAAAKFKLSVRSSTAAPQLKLQTRVDRI